MINDVVNFTGANLKYCRVNRLQCCNNGYFEKQRQRITEQITEDLRDELNEQIDDFNDIVDAVENG